jgi:tripeptidyl-peptidase-2
VDPIIAPLGERDTLPSLSKEIYQLVLEYDFEQEEKGSFIPRADALQGVLYESAFESQLMQVFDGEKKYLGVVDAYPSSVTAPKGTILIRLQIRHDDPTKLEKLKDMVIWIERSIEKEISLSIYPTKEALMTSGGTLKRCVLRKGSGASVYIAEPPPSKIPSGCKAGDIIQGSVSFGSGDASLPGDGKRPGGYVVSYTVGPKAKKASSDPETPELKDERSVEEKLLEAVRDLKVGQLSKLTQKEKDDGMFEDIYGKIESEYPDFLPLLMARLKYLDMHEKRSEKFADIVSAADAVLVLVPENELALHFGRKIDSEDPAAVKVSWSILISFFCELEGSDAKPTSRHRKERT